MTSTDGIFAHRPPPKAELGKELGKLDAKRGRLQIYRERLYIFDPDKPQHHDDCPKGCRNKHPVYAMHGYQGTLDELRALPLEPGIVEYIAQRMVTNRMSTGRVAGERHSPGEFVYEPRALWLPGEGVGPDPPKH